MTKKKIFYPIPSLCKCGCNKVVWNGREWQSGHNLKVIEYTENRNKKISIALIGIKRSKETKQKLSEINKGKHHSPRTEFKKGHNTWNRGIFGYKNIPHTEETKIKISESTKEQWKNEEHRKFMSERFSGKNSNFYGKRPKHSKGKRLYYESPLQGEICFRSSYELIYAKWLDDNKILWYYEIQTFELSNEETYTPDFFLIKDDKFIEIKGYMKKESQEKIDKFKEEYPFDLEILYKEDLIKLGCNIK